MTVNTDKVYRLSRVQREAVNLNGYAAPLVNHNGDERFLQAQRTVAGSSTGRKVSITM